MNFDKNIVKLASQILIQHKQRKLDSLRNSSNEKIRALAIDYYGLSLINSNYGPSKLEMVFNKFEEMWQNLGFYDIS